MNDLNEPVGILVRVVMRSESDGGRHCPFTEGYMPHFIILGETEWLGVRAIQSPGPVAPGDTAEVIFAPFYHSKVDYSALRVGTKFAIHEGPKIVGFGEVLKEVGGLQSSRTSGI